jgi:hypothetical protein
MSAFPIRVQRVILCLAILLSCYATPARPGFWDITITAQAFLPDGTTGIETVIYRYDPAGIAYTDCIGFPTFPCPPGGVPGFETSIGLISSVRYFGLVNGQSAAPVILFSRDDIVSPDIFSQWGGSSTSGLGSVRLWANPEPLDITLSRVLGHTNIAGGEDGWTWNFQGHSPAATWHFTLLPVPALEPGTLLLVITSCFALACMRKAQARATEV